MPYVTGYEDGARYEHIEEDDLGKGDVHATDRGARQGGYMLYGTVHEADGRLQDKRQCMGYRRQESETGLQGCRQQHEEGTEKEQSYAGRDDEVGEQPIA